MKIEKGMILKRVFDRKGRVYRSADIIFKKIIEYNGKDLYLVEYRITNKEEIPISTQFQTEITVRDFKMKDDEIYIIWYIGHILSKYTVSNSEELNKEIGKLMEM